MSLSRWWPFYLGLNVLTLQVPVPYILWQYNLYHICIGCKQNNTYDGSVQERCNSTAEALELVFLALTHRYKDSMTLSSLCLLMSRHQMVQGHQQHASRKSLKIFLAVMISKTFSQTTSFKLATYINLPAFWLFEKNSDPLVIRHFIMRFSVRKLFWIQI